jgi:hypothetical protein
MLANQMLPPPQKWFSKVPIMGIIDEVTQIEVNIASPMRPL